MISSNIAALKQICNEITKVENYDEALTSNELYVLHHCAEFRFTANELKQMNAYYNRPPEELIFIPVSLHNECTELHIGRVRAYNKAKGKSKPRKIKPNTVHVKSNAAEEIERLKALQAFYKAVSK